ncbi:MAG: hypothetical protein MUE40_07350 [Anaerolineae bacterium]|nr:hypothetical protein [Anaerolineae bacterium]
MKATVCARRTRWPAWCGAVCAAGLLLAGCAADVVAPTLRPTRAVSGPTLVASPTIHLQTSGELYGESEFNPGQNDPTAAALPSRSGLPPLVVGTPAAAGPQRVQMVLPDGVLLGGQLYTRGISRVPGLLLLAPAEAAWGTLPQRLHDAGFTVLVVTPRQPALPADLDTVLLALSEIGTVDPSLIGVLAAGSSTDMAFTGCAANGLCDAVVLLSPAGRETLLTAMNAYRPRPVLVIAGQDDAAGYAAAVALASAASGLSQLITYPAGSGTALLAQHPELNDSITAWVGQVLVLQPPPP